MGAERGDLSLSERAGLLEALLERLLDADERGAAAIVGRALAIGWTVDDVRFSLITPALHDVGVRWERAEIGVSDEHLASSICEWLLYRLAGRMPRAADVGRRAVVGCSDGELHALGARIVAHVLVEQGWRVLYVGAATPPDAWSDIVRARRPDAAILCTTMRPHLERVRPALRAIKAARPQCRTVVGGQAYWGMPDPSAAVDADLVVLDARQLATRLQ
jgi:methanogenic corrinoid protein MtbC1